ncbi:SnoaL-like domain-containing protein [Armillaria luteobubalina]|uniref:SnoaL-like domain-containing protein n=1 Tax=Armillaria luteobubalina TaxID=153913 RepID=A0AA39QDL3_9AGAR|nr:SnoaL-like domain-containing protein [Armillaria luteobubalina]
MTHPCYRFTYIQDGNPVLSTTVAAMPSTTSYSAIDYLLDKANIHDTVTKLMLYVDLLRWDDLEKEVFTDDIHVDYTSLFGGEAVNVKSKDQIGAWKSLFERIEKSQHLLTSLIIDLPQPGSVPPPKKVQIYANYLVTLVLKDSEQKLVQNGGRYLLEVSRITPSDGGNPWRISSAKADVVYFTSNKEFYDHAN